MPVLGVGALSLAILGGGIAYFAVFEAGSASADKELKSAAVAAASSAAGTLGASGPVRETQKQAVVATMEPVAVKTVTITPKLLDKGILAPNRQENPPADTVVADARWGYKTGPAEKAATGSGMPPQQTAYASINAAAAKPWPVVRPGTDEATDEAAGAAAPAAQPTKEPAPAKSAPATVALEKAKYQDTINDYVNMRTGPRSRSDVIMVVPKGSTVGVIECRSWCKIVYDGRQGWVYKRYVGSAQASAAPAASETAAEAQGEAPAKPERTLIQRIISGGDQMSTR